jgi:hypothetical protein
MPAMRTTLTIADDVLTIARQLAKREKLSLGDALSKLARAGAHASLARAALPPEVTLRGRFALLPVRDEVITVAQVRALLDRHGI